MKKRKRRRPHLSPCPLYLSKEEARQFLDAVFAFSVVRMEVAYIFVCGGGGVVLVTRKKKWRGFCVPRVISLLEEGPKN